MSVDGAGYVDLGGTVRARTAEETLAWLRPVCSRAGITRIARVTGLDHVGIAVSIAVRPLARNLTVSQGKGLSAALADASAMMEAIEAWHAEDVRPSDLEGSYEVLRRHHPVLDPLTLPVGPFPRLIDLRARPAQWFLADDLVGGEPFYVPRWFCALERDAAVPEWLSCPATSNGLAGGNTLEEATCHALCEVIERDATAHFEDLPETEKRARAIAPESVGGAAGELVARIESAGLTMDIVDEQSSVGVPAFRCVLDDPGQLRGLGAFAGHGAHLSTQIALCRAITEAAQSRLTLIAGTRDDKPPWAYEMTRQSVGRVWSRSPAIRSFDELRPAARLTGSFAGDLQCLLERLVAAGFERVLRVNLTRETVGVPVVMVVVPHARVHPE